MQSSISLAASVLQGANPASGLEGRSKRRRKGFIASGVSFVALRVCLYIYGMPSNEKTRFFYLKQVGIGQFFTVVGGKLLYGLLLGGVWTLIMLAFHFVAAFFGFESSPRHPSAFDQWVKSLPLGVWSCVIFAVIVWSMRGQTIHEKLPNLTVGERLSLIALFAVATNAYYDLPWWISYTLSMCLFQLVDAYGELASEGQEMLKRRHFVPAAD